jgi:voltage-dependent anion channel protein 2
MEYKQQGVLSRAHVDLFKGPIFNGDVCFGRDGILFGSEVGYDVLDGRVTRYNATVGINNPIYALTIQAAGNMTQFSASYYHRVSSDVEVGGKAFWDSKSKNANMVAMEVGGKVTLDKNASVKAKVDHVGKLSLAYTQSVRPGVKVTMAGVFDTAKLNENAHKVGLGVVFEN